LIRDGTASQNSDNAAHADQYLQDRRKIAEKARALLTKSLERKETIIIADCDRVKFPAEARNGRRTLPGAHSTDFFRHERTPRRERPAASSQSRPVNHSITMMSSNRQSAASRIALPVADVGRRAHSRFEFNARSKQF
jgi:hypothetical protein